MRLQINRHGAKSARQPRQGIFLFNDVDRRSKTRTLAILALLAPWRFNPPPPTSLACIRFAAEDRHGSIELLREHNAGQAMRQGESR